MQLAAYLLVGFFVATRYFTPAMLIVLAALPVQLRNLPSFLKPRPETRPEGFPDGQGGWPLYFAPLSFQNNRAFGLCFMLGLAADTVLRLLPATRGFWR